MVVEWRLLHQKSPLTQFGFMTCFWVYDLFMPQLVHCTWIGHVSVYDDDQIDKHISDTSLMTPKC